MTPKVSIIILNYNGKKHTISCLRSLEKMTYQDKEIILYDNGSTDGTGREIKKLFPKVKVIHVRQNKGYCGGTNDAYQYASGKYILFLNNDTTVTENFLAPMIRRMEEDSRNGIVQPKLVFQNTKKLQAGCTFFTPTGFLYYTGYGKDPQASPYNIPMKMYSANGACMLVKREVIDTVGLFDKDFFLYVEETDFCHRALLAGYTVWYEPKALVRHIGSADNSGYKHSLLVYYSCRNRMVSYIKNFGVAWMLTVFPLHVLLNMTLVCAYALSGRPQDSFAVCKALMYNVWNIKQTLLKRTYVQKHLRRRADADFLPEVSRNPRWEYYVRLLNGLERYRE